MSQIFNSTLERTVGDEVPVYFTWPRTGETFTYQVSFDGGETLSAGQETIEEIPDDGVPAEYIIPYNSDERTAVAGIVLLIISDGTDTAKIWISIQKATAAASSFTADYSAYGPKRVRTKEMEIEQFDPRIVQETELRASREVPCFGDSKFCTGYPDPCPDRYND